MIINMKTANQNINFRFNFGDKDYNKKPAPKQIPNRENKWEYLVKKYGYLCPIYKFYYKNKVNYIINSYPQPTSVTDLHHMCHNTKVNRKLYPLFIHSLLNLLPVNNAWHLKYPSFRKISDRRAERYERFLERHPKICKFVNCEE